MTRSRWRRVGAGLLSAFWIGCGSDDGDSQKAPTPTVPAAATFTMVPAATATPTTGNRLDIGICAPSAGAFSSVIDNPYFPLPAGAQWILAGEDEDGAALRVVVTSLDETEVVAGVTTRVVEERESEDGALVEVSRNFFAQTTDGTVCYYGEDVDIYEDGEIVAHDGAWRAGVDGALPGIFMPANPQVGQVFSQEIAPGIAEDEAELVAAGETVDIELGTFTDTIRFLERNPLDGGTSEKLYGRGVGLLVDVPIERVTE